MMKRFLFTLTYLLLFFNFTGAQSLDDSLQAATREAREASRAVGQFTADNNQKDLLREALANVRSATGAIEEITVADLKKNYDKKRHQHRAQRKLADIWEAAGKVYLEIANQITTAEQLNLDRSELPEADYPALKAAEAMKNALNFADRNFQIRSITNAMTTLQGALNNMGTMAFENAKDYPRAYLNFYEVIELHRFLTENSGTSLLDSEAALNDQRYYAGLSALNAQMTSQAAQLFRQLYDNDYDNPTVYEAMYKVTKDTDMEKAYNYLKAGRDKYADDTGLLFAEINHFLALNKLDELISRLQTAIEKEPNNASLYATLGNVYDNLFQREMRAEESDEAQTVKYFDRALANFERALEIDPAFFDAVYSIGTLYYNKAAILVERMQAMEDDYSKEALEKYEVLREQVLKQFDLALPYFQECEKMNPNDVNTLIALREVYARKDMLDMVDIFNQRLEKVQNGEEYEASYFQK